MLTKRGISRKTSRLPIQVCSADLIAAGLGSQTNFEVIADPENGQLIIRAAKVQKTRWPGVSKIVIGNFHEVKKERIFASPKVSNP